MTKRIVDKLSYDVLGAAIEVHKDVGPDWSKVFIRSA